MRYAILSLIVIFASSCAGPYKDVPLAAPVSYAEGEDALAQGRYVEAARHFRSYLADERPTYRARAYYQLAQAQYHLEDYLGAQESLATLEQEFPGFGRKQTEALQGDLAYALGDPVDAILLWEAAYEKSTPTEREALQPRIAGAMQTLPLEDAKELAGMLTVPQLYEMAIDRVAGPTAGRPALVAVAGSTVAGATGPDHERVVSDVAPPPIMPAELSASERLAIEQSSPDEQGAVIVAATELHPVVDETAAEQSGEAIVVAALDPDSVEGGAASEAGVHIGPRVAALLPLTGAARDAGRAALISLRNSLDDATLMTRDTGSNPAIAVELLRQLAADPDVIAVLGPVHPPVIDAVRREAKSLNLPILPLRTDTPMRVVGTPTRALATYAVRDLQLTRIGILTPDPTAAGGFADAAVSLGATVAGTHVYDPTNLDLNAVLAAVQTWIDTGGVDAVYVAESAPRGVEIAKAARAVAPQLVLLGDQTWGNPAILAGDATAIEGAIIVGNPRCGAVHRTERYRAARRRRFAESDRSRRNQPRPDAVAPRGIREPREQTRPAPDRRRPSRADPVSRSGQGPGPELAGRHFD